MSWHTKVVSVMVLVGLMVLETESSKEAVCAKMKDMGQCEKDPNWMEANCDKTCVVTGVGYSPQGGSLCQDTDTRCRIYVAKGLCRLPRVEDSCCYSCKTEKKVCKDKNRGCTRWAKGGHCGKNKRTMLHLCKKSCGFCQTGDKKQTNVAWTMRQACSKLEKLDLCNSDPVWIKANCKGKCKAKEEGYVHRGTADCRDTDRRCRRYSRRGLCRLPRVEDSCCAACKDEEKCLDRNRGCKRWAKGGHCQLNKRVMFRLCKLSCGFCDPEISAVHPCENLNGGCSQICTETKDQKHYCECKPGYVLQTDEETCIADVNECELDNGGCQHECVNTDGSFHCSCRTGFVLGVDKKECTEIHEDEEGHGKEDCEDKRDNCPALAAQDLCEHPTHHDFMMMNCAVSCDECQCRDHKPECHGWAIRGECQTNPMWMLLHCSASCHVCAEDDHHDEDEDHHGDEDEDEDEDHDEDEDEDHDDCEDKWSNCASLESTGGCRDPNVQKHCCHSCEDYVKELESKKGCIDAWGNCPALANQGWCRQGRVTQNCCDSCKNWKPTCTDQWQECRAYAKGDRCEVDQNVKKMCCAACEEAAKIKKEKPKPKPKPDAGTAVGDPSCKDLYSNCKALADGGHCGDANVKKSCCASCKNWVPPKVVDFEGDPKMLAGLLACPRSKKGYGMFRDTTGGAKGLKEACLNSANWFRARHENTAPFEWDDTLAHESQHYADELASYGKPNWFEHDHRNSEFKWGENIYASTVDDTVENLCALANKDWYSEIFHYDAEKGNSRTGYAVGHYTAQVWQGTTKIGVGVTKRLYRGTMMVYVVAKYLPAGNTQDKFVANVLPRKAEYEKECIEQYSWNSYAGILF